MKLNSNLESALEESSSRLAVLMATFNRVETTLSCLASLTGAVSGIHTNVFVFDDGSTDGTLEALERFTNLRLHAYQGTGNLYWARSMYEAQYAASVYGEFDFYLLLNDDSILEENCIDRMASLSKQFSPSAVVVGAVANLESSEILYGGIQICGPGPLRQRLINPGDRPIAIDTFHGNVVLIPAWALDAVGGIDGSYEHAFADIDLGLRLKKAGVQMFLAPMIAARALPNSDRIDSYGFTWHFIRRLRILTSRKEMPPRSMVKFLRRHTGNAWPLYFLYVYLRTFLPRGK